VKKIKLLIKIFFIISAFLIIFNKIDLNEIKNIKLQNPFFLLIAFLLFNLSQIISAFRIQHYLSHIKITPQFKKQLMLYYVGMFYNTLLPGGIGGDAYKAYKFEKEFKTGYKQIIKALLIDRISGLFAIFTLVGILIFFSNFKIFIIYISFLAIISPITLFIIHKSFFKEFKFYPFVYSLIIQSLQALTFVFILYSLGFKDYTVDLVILFFISSVISVIPLSVGGVGLRELTFLYGMEFIHLNPAIGIISAFIFFLITLISSAFGSFFINKVEKIT